MSKDAAFRAYAFRHGKKYVKAPTGHIEEQPAPASVDPVNAAGDIPLKHIWDEVVKDTHELIAWVEGGSKAVSDIPLVHLFSVLMRLQEGKPTILKIYEQTQSTVYDQVADAFRTFYSRA